MRSPARSFPPLETSRQELEKILADASVLNPSFFLQDTLTVAKGLIGKGLHVKKPEGSALVQLVEVEAYLGEGKDPASHAHRGLTRRNEPMFESGGICYVYLSYGLNYCMNVVTGKKGEGEAVLLRAAVPLYGIALMAKRRGLKQKDAVDFSSLKKLLSGPGKLTQALGIDLSYNGRAFDNKLFSLLDLGHDVGEQGIDCSPRIGISKATEHKFRFFVNSSPWLSRKS